MWRDQCAKSTSLPTGLLRNPQTPSQDAQTKGTRHCFLQVLSLSLSAAAQAPRCLLPPGVVTRHGLHL